MKQFEISYYHHVYFGDYFFEDNHLEVENVHTFLHEDGNMKFEIDSLDDKEIFDKVYALVEKKHGDEAMSESEYEAELRYSIAEEKADEKRKYK